MRKKAVLISIKPKWCELIANGKKTIEVRKTRPKLETPFKCYIYCTKPKMITKYVFKPEDYPEYMRPEKPVFCKVPDDSSPYCSKLNGNSKVIGEFVCKEILPITVEYSDINSRVAMREFPFTCLTDREIIDYLGNGKQGYSWHISDLVIYDKPKELSELYIKCSKYDLYKKEVYESYCTDCGNKHGISPCEYINEKWCIPLKSPPQSWCYVE